MATFCALTRLRIGRGGKMDDTSCVVAEIIEWTVSLTHSTLSALTTSTQADKRGPGKGRSRLGRYESIGSRKSLHITIICFDMKGELMITYVLFLSFLACWICWGGGRSQAASAPGSASEALCAEGGLPQMVQFLALSSGLWWRWEWVPWLPLIYNHLLQSGNVLHFPGCTHIFDFFMQCWPLGVAAPSSMWSRLQEYDGEMTPPGFRKKGRRSLADQLAPSIFRG